MNDENYKKVLAHYIRWLRLMNGMSQLDVAKKLKKTTNAISNWELGNTSPPVDDIMKLCEIYNVTPNQMLGVDPIPDLTIYINEHDSLLLELQDIEERHREILKQEAIIKQKMKELKLKDKKPRRRI